MIAPVAFTDRFDPRRAERPLPAMNLKDLAVEDVHELTPLQQELAAGSPRAKYQFVYRLNGLDQPAFRQAWAKVIERHAVLRTSVHTEGMSKPVQVVHRQAAFRPEVHDWRDVPQNEMDDRLDGFLSAERSKSFALTLSPLQRWDLLTLDGGAALFVWSFHPLILDRRSAQRVWQEVCATYRALTEGTAVALPPARKFREYVARVRERGIHAAAGFWQQDLRDYTVPTPQPEADPTGGTCARPTEEQLRIAPPLLARLLNKSKQLGVTVGTLLQGSWALLLGHYHGRGRYVFAVAAPSGGEEPPVGPTHSPLPVHVRVEGDLAVGDWLKEIHARHAAAQPFDHLPPGVIRDCSEVPPGGRLFITLLEVEPRPASLGTVKLGDEHLPAQPVRTSGGPGDCPLVLTAAASPAGIELRLTACTPLQAGGGNRILKHYRGLLARLADAAPEARLADLVPLRPGSRAALTCFRARGPRPTLFCIHPAGGGALGYAALANRLGPDVPVYAFEARGLDGRQKPNERIEDMAASYCETLLLAQPRGPYFLAGWSSGGLVAYEMARQLTAAGHAVGLLALLDTAAPGHEEAQNLGPRAVMLRLARQMGVNLAGRDDVKAAGAEELPALLVAAGHAAAVLPPGFTEADFRRRARLYRIHAAASRAYAPQPYPGPVTLLRAAKSVAGGASAPHLGWDRLAGSVVLEVLPGDHNSLMREPNVAALAARLIDRFPATKEI
jgi:thioesterase domain-containing protein